MADFDYSVPAELFLTTGGWRNAPMKHRRFASAALAIQYAMEGSKIAPLGGTVMEIDEERFDLKEISRLYAAPGYPLYYLNVMASDSGPRKLAFTDDEPHHWIRATWEGMALDPRLPMTSAAGVVMR